MVGQRVVVPEFERRTDDFGYTVQLTQADSGEVLDHVRRDQLLDPLKLAVVDQVAVQSDCFVDCPPVGVCEVHIQSPFRGSPHLSPDMASGMSPESNLPTRSGPPRARRVDAERNRSALLAAARTLFAERGPEAPLDEVARRAGVANATLYRHFPTRMDLIVAVYSGEVAELNDLARRLLNGDHPGHALTMWLAAFVRHVTHKRDLALALPEDPANRRGALFAEWHSTMTSVARSLLDHAQAAGAVRPEISVADLLALASGIALTGLPDARLDSLLRIVQQGYATQPT